MDYHKSDETEIIVVCQKAVISDNGKVLILKGASEMGGKWELPGGTLEAKESLEAGLKREVKEETDLDIGGFKLLGVFDAWHKDFKFQGGKVADAHSVVLVFSCQKESGEIKLSGEHEDFMWAGREDLDELEFGSNSIKLVSLLKDILPV